MHKSAGCCRTAYCVNAPAARAISETNATSAEKATPRAIAVWFETGRQYGTDGPMVGGESNSDNARHKPGDDDWEEIPFASQADFARARGESSGRETEPPAEPLPDRNGARKSRSQKARAAVRHPAEPEHVHPAEPEHVHSAEPEHVHLTDLGNARRLVKRHGIDLHNCHPFKAWSVWDDVRWQDDNTGETVRRFERMLAVEMQEADQELMRVSRQLENCSCPEEEDELNARVNWLQRLLAHLVKSESAKAIKDGLELARSEPGIPILPEELDRDPFAFNVLNGTLDLHTGTLRPHDRADLITKLAPVQYDPAAECPLWDKFLIEIFDGNEDLIAYLQRVCGYCLTGDVSEQCLWFFYGTGANGKSTFLSVLLALLGDYGMQAVSDLLVAKKSQAHPTERADLHGSRFVATIESDAGARLAEALMKQLTGGDKIRARKMYKDFFQFDATHKLFLAANHKPNVGGTDHAVWRRIKLVPFTVTIAEEKKDPHLLDKLKAELSGILNWAIAGLLAWQRHGLGEPDEVRMATSEYRAEQDTLAAFLRDVCTLQPFAKCRANALHEAYVEFSGDTETSRIAFGRRLRDQGYTTTETGGVTYWVGIGLPAKPWERER
jgi:putative DNA primase/helicase